MEKMNEWDHVFKLDPNKKISDQDLQSVCESGTDAIIVGGTDGVTFENVHDLWERIEPYEVPCLLEISDIEAITPGFDGYLIPIVLNSQHKKWLLDIQHHAVKEYGDIIDWKSMATEGYCVLNPDAKVYQHTNCYLPDDADVLAYARIAEHLFQLPIFYLEYSGTYGDPKLVQRIAEELNQTTLFYGGGIHTPEQAREMSAHADVIVVGNIIYENIQAALATVQAAKST
ncbi:heptaprenylglyceryl phosphate synthase [Halobacillus mangrovi]|uniref:Heptaprenylglyceryl phosphate synthase n=1 Tax=Halobacillus mangrovi TaxID=402384 RepID=A0A1W5ZZ91_9BACI|nr:heptaprenylglyceryl phosphate synthase [Halobacillus mangrovi]ARI78579.1 geranylgeranylglyceryl/heptaprenylglyceryl phosphate synthase [Halobacillus mangrovi]